jgi:hypothetical protein
MMNYITGSPNFKDFASWIERIPNSAAHMNIGFSMATMASPDDPIYFLHQSNIDRLYTLWADCHDYEHIPADQITDAQYESFHPTSFINPYTGEPFAKDKDDSIPYAFTWDTKRHCPVESLVFPQPWPSPRMLWSSINGYKGLDVRYGPDNLVLSLGETCTSNTQWTLVNLPYTKRSLSAEEGAIHPKLQGLKEKFRSGVSAGSSHREVIHSMAMEECQSTPKFELNKALLDWSKMNNLGITAFDSMCDKPSERWLEMQGADQQGQTKALDNSDGSTTMPLWVILTAALGMVVVLIAVIVLIILYLRKKNSVSYSDNDYNEMN